MFQSRSIGEDGGAAEFTKIILSKKTAILLFTLLISYSNEHHSETFDDEEIAALKDIWLGLSREDQKELLIVNGFGTKGGAFKFLMENASNWFVV